MALYLLQGHRIYVKHTELASSNWILNEDATLTVSYKISFDSATGTQWEGPLEGPDTLEDVLLDGYAMANEVYLNYTDVIQDTASAVYEYSPVITKDSVVDGDTIDYTVKFRNTVPGSGGNDGYLDASTGTAYFVDTFDERLEYVKDTLIVTCYDPWCDDLWLNKYIYRGEITGNTMNIPADQFVLLETNPAAASVGWSDLENFPNLKSHYNWLNAGGDYVYTYTLKLKDEYLNATTENKYYLDNTSEITWDGSGTTGPVTNTSVYETGIVDKSVVQQGSKLEFDIHINENALDILDGVDTLTIDDTMTPNLSLYWETIKLLYEDENGNWIDFDSPDSNYDYTVTYDNISNRLTFVVPDSLHIRIDYTTLITENGNVSVANTVKIEGRASLADVIDAIFRVENYSGGASGSVHRTTLLKQDGDTDEPIPNVCFNLYGPMGDPDADVAFTMGAKESIVMEDGTVLYYIGTYVTGADGTTVIETQYLTTGGPYALEEIAPAEGYNPLGKPVYFYFYDTDPNGVIQTVTTMVVVENYTYGFVLPETGGLGILPLTIIGTVLLAFPILYGMIRRRRERRFD